MGVMQSKARESSASTKWWVRMPAWTFAYEHTAEKLVQQVRRQGSSGCFINLGLTRSGKTFMMEGDEEELSHGVVIRAVSELLFYGNGSEPLRANTWGPPKWSVGISHCQIYGDGIYDLLDRGMPLELEEDAEGNIVLDGLSEMRVTQYSEAEQLLENSWSKRDRMGTRSIAHSLITLHLYREDSPLPERKVPLARIIFLDMAGAEPAKDVLESQISMHDIEYLQESNEALQTCLSRHLWLQQGGLKEPLDIPYRSSKVTHLLKGVFVGQTHLGLCLNVSSLAADFCGETLQLLEQLSLPRGGRRMPGPSRQLDEPAAPLPHQPQRVAQKAGQPKRALGPKDEADAAPVHRKKPARDVRIPRAEEMLYAEQEQSQRWRAQAMRLQQEVSIARSAARSQWDAFTEQLETARLLSPGDIAALTRQRDDALAQLRQSEAARAEEAARAKKDLDEQSACLRKFSTQFIAQRNEQSEARAAAESRAAVLEQQLSAAQSQVSELKEECGRVSAAKDASEDLDDALLALGELDMELSASRAQNEQAEWLIAQLRIQLEEASAARSMAEEQNGQLSSQLQAAESANASMAARLCEAQQASQAAGEAAQKDRQRAAVLTALLAAMEQQLGDLQKSQKERSAKVAKAREQARERIQQAQPTCAGQRMNGAAAPVPKLPAHVEHQEDTGSQAASAGDGDQPAQAPAAAAAPDQAAEGGTAPGTPRASAGARIPRGAYHVVHPSPMLLQACKAMARVDSPMAVERATPAKRARDEGTGRAPRPKLAAVPAAIYQEERRVRQRVASGMAPDQDAAAQSHIVAGAAPQPSVPAARGPERAPLAAGREQPAAAKSGHRRSHSASQIRTQGRRPVTCSDAASKQAPNVLPAIPERSLATGAQSSAVPMETQASVAAPTKRIPKVARKPIAPARHWY